MRGKTPGVQEAHSQEMRVLEELVRVLDDKKKMASLRTLSGDRAQLMVNYMHSVSH